MDDYQPAARIDPEILQLISFSLRCTEPDLIVPSFALASTIDYILVAHFLIIRTPSVRKDGVWWDVLTHELGEAEAAIILDV
jgi:hypothetical protein